MGFALLCNRKDLRLLGWCHARNQVIKLFSGDCLLRRGKPDHQHTGKLTLSPGCGLQANMVHTTYFLKTLLQLVHKLQTSLGVFI